MWRFIIYFFLFSCSRSQRTQDTIINFVRDTLHEIEKVFKSTDYIRQKSMHTPAFEIGFVMRNMEECYRRMVDIYNSSLTTDLNNLDTKPSDHIMFLKHVEILYWVIDHLNNMLHEVEKKYKVKVAGMFEKQRVWTVPTPPSSFVTYFQSKAIVEMSTTTTRPKQQWWPLDYGWEMNYWWR